MGGFVKGDLVVIPFPFSDLSTLKRRPALVITTLQGDDIILCQITSKEIKDNYSLLLRETDYNNGTLNKESNIRPNKLFTADKNIVLYKIGSIKKSLMDKVVEKIIDIITS